MGKQGEQIKKEKIRKGEKKGKKRRNNKEGKKRRKMEIFV